MFSGRCRGVPGVERIARRASLSASATSPPLTRAGERAVELRRAEPGDARPRPARGGRPPRRRCRGQHLRGGGEVRGPRALAGFEDDEPERAPEAVLELLGEELDREPPLAVVVGEADRRLARPACPPCPRKCSTWGMGLCRSRSRRPAPVAAGPSTGSSHSTSPASIRSPSASFRISRRPPVGEIASTRTAPRTPRELARDRCWSRRGRGADPASWPRSRAPRPACRAPPRGRLAARGRRPRAARGAAACLRPSRRRACPISPASIASWSACASARSSASSALQRSADRLDRGGEGAHARRGPLLCRGRGPWSAGRRAAMRAHEDLVVPGEDEGELDRGSAGLAMRLLARDSRGRCYQVPRPTASRPPDAPGAHGVRGSARGRRGEIRERNDECAAPLGSEPLRLGDIVRGRGRSRSVVRGGRDLGEKPLHARHDVVPRRHAPNLSHHGASHRGGTPRGGLATRAGDVHPLGR